MSVVLLVRRHPFVAFVALACLLGWSLFLAAWLGLVAQPTNLPLGPLAAAALVTTCQGRAAVGAWWRRLRGWAMSPWLYVLAVVGPLALQLLDVGVNTALGAPAPTGEQWAGWPQVLPELLVALLVVGVGEEAGWSAFAAPLLRGRHTLLATWALLASVRVFWHLPLLLSGEMSWPVWVFGNAGYQLLLLVVFELPRARWTFAAVWHATLNAFGGSFVFGFVAGADLVRLDLLLALTYGVVGAGAYAVHALVQHRRGMRQTVTTSRWEEARPAARVGER